MTISKSQFARSLPESYSRETKTVLVVRVVLDLGLAPSIHDSRDCAVFRQSSPQDKKVKTQKHGRCSVCAAWQTSPAAPLHLAERLGEKGVNCLKEKCTRF